MMRACSAAVAVSSQFGVQAHKAAHEVSNGARRILVFFGI